MATTTTKPPAKPVAKKKKPAVPKKPKLTAAQLKKIAHNKALIHEIVKWAHWFHLHGRFMPYTMSAGRDDWLNKPIGKYPIDTDCSGFVTLCYAWAGANDPNGLNAGVFKPGHWHALGYTGTLLDHAKDHGHIFGHAKDAQQGDLLVVGPGTGDHVMLVVEAGDDPLCVSHGSEGVWYVRAHQDTRTPHRYCRFLDLTGK